MRCIYKPISVKHSPLSVLIPSEEAVADNVAPETVTPEMVEILRFTGLAGSFIRIVADNVQELLSVTVTS